MKCRRWTITGSALLLAGALGGCGGDAGARAETEGPAPVKSSGGEKPAAETELVAAPGENIDATATFYDEGYGVRVVMEVEDALPGKHGVHVHEKGDCSNLAKESMGEHLKPDEQDHGLPEDDERHLGDLGNIEVGEDGTGTLDVLVEDANLDLIGGAMSFTDRALVIRDVDDFGEGTSGEAGDPIACGVIRTEPQG